MVPDVSGTRVLDIAPGYAEAPELGERNVRASFRLLKFGSASAVHKRFLEWEKAGFFEALWQAGLAEYDQMEGVAWRWQSIDGALLKAPMAQQTVGPNPTDRGKKWKQATPAGGRAWRPVVDHRDRGQRE